VKRVERNTFMVRLRWVALLAFWASFMISLASSGFAQRRFFNITVPFKGTNTPSNPFPPIGTVKAIVSVTSSAGVTFTVTLDQSPTPASFSFSTVSPGSSQPASQVFTYAGFASTDTVSLIPPTNHNDPPTYEIDFHVQSDSNTSCAAQHPARTFTISVGATDPQITGVCLESWDSDSAGCAPINDSFHLIPIPLDNPKDTVATVMGQPSQTRGSCQRLPIDVVMILDKSGSMANSSLGTAAHPKIVSLQNAVKNFVDVWDGLRGQEATQGAGSVRADKVGVIIFDSTAKWWGDPGLNPGLLLGQNLNLIDSSNNPNASISSFLSSCTAISCGELIPGASTSIGAGLVLADNKLGASGIAGDGNRHVVLVMTDGIQNTDPRVRAYDPLNPTDTNPLNPTQIATYSSSSPSVVTPLPNSSTYLTYPVTVGTGSAVDTAFATGISRIPGSFYMNTEDNATLLGPMFLELLQNFLRFFSYETVRMISEPTPYSATVPITATSHNIAVSLMWPNQLGTLRLTITPPGGTQPIVQESGSGFISIIRELPLPSPYDPFGDWKIQVDKLRLVGVPNAPRISTSAGASGSTTADEIPFNLHVMTDDGGVKSNLRIAPGDYKPGDKIKLQAKLIRFGRPILGLGSHPGDRIEAELIKPGNSIGDVLSDSKASADTSCPASGPCDQQTPAEAKLANTLKSNPSALTHTSDTVQLFDDGKPEHGDDVAGDGIYSALYPANLVGNYNFLFAVESTDPNAVRFSRQQLRTAYVRAVLDKDNKTTFQSTIQPCTARLTSLRGTVFDPQGAAVPRATVTATNASSGSIMTTTTDSTGSYQFAALTPGQYQITTQMGGTATALFTGIPLLAGHNAIYNILFKAGGAAAQIVNAGNATACNNLIVTMKPRTKFGNRLGPGWANYLWLTTPNGTAYKPKDNLNGTYTATLNYIGSKAPDAFLHFENVIAIIGDSVTADQLPQKLDASNVVAKVPPPSSGKWAVFFDAGVNMPLGTFGNTFNHGFSLNAGLEYMWTSYVSLEGIFGYHHFPGKTTLPITVADQNVYQFSGNAKFYLRPPPNRLRPFVNGGIGGYHFSSGSTTAFGSNFGGGLLYEINQHWGVQDSYNFHLVNTSGATTQFSTYQGGVRFVF
jgi:carboxypeptidase family protein/outer membrane protein with beta-barrel domain